MIVPMRNMRSHGPDNGRLRRPPLCPRCGACLVRQTPAGGVLDHLLAFVRIKVFRCQICTKRFRAPAWRTRHPELVSDLRQYRRFQAECLATFFDGQTVHKGWVVALSMGGCTLQISTPLPRGTFVDVELWPSSQVVPIRAAVAMVRSVNPGSIGLQFLEFTPSEQVQLSRFIYNLWLGQLAVTEAGA